MAELQEMHGMPAAYSDADQEYRQARENAVVFDLSRRAKVSLVGPETISFLHNLCSNEVRQLKPGDGCEAFLTTPKAKIVAHVFLTHIGTDEEPNLLLDAEPGQAETLLKHLDHYLISEQVELSDQTDSVALFHVCGPSAQNVADNISSETLCIRRNDRVGLLGFDVFQAKDKAPVLQEAFAKSGVEQAGGQAFEWLRVEAGVPVFGCDMDENRFVMEVGRTEQAISFTKGCFLGQEPIVMARDRGQVNRRFTGIRFADGDAISPDATVTHDGQDVGRVTSSVVSPALQCPIALAYLKRGHHEPGTNVTVDGREGVVAELPFVKN